MKPDQDHQADAQPTTPKPTPTTPKPTPTTPKPTPTTPKPTVTPTAGGKQVIRALSTPFDLAQQGTATQERTAAATNTGSGDTGLAGAAVDWLAGLLGL